MEKTQELLRSTKCKRGNCLPPEILFVATFGGQSLGLCLRPPQPTENCEDPAGHHQEGQQKPQKCCFPSTRVKHFSNFSSQVCKN